MKDKNFYIYLLFMSLLFLSACMPAKITGSLVKTAGKLSWEAAKLSGKTVYHSSRLLHKGIRTAVYMVKGKEIIPLKKQGNSLYVRVLLNRRVYANLLLDTGASSVQISSVLARKLKIDYKNGQDIYATLAGGHVVNAKSVVIKEIKLGGVRVQNVNAIVIENDNMQDEDGLLGMSFLNYFSFKIDPEKPELILQRKV